MLQTFLLVQRNVNVTLKCIPHLVCNELAPSRNLPNNVIIFTLLLITFLTWWQDRKVMQSSLGMGRSAGVWFSVKCAGFHEYAYWAESNKWSIMAKDFNESTWLGLRRNTWSRQVKLLISSSLTLFLKLKSIPSRISHLFWFCRY